MCYVRTPAAPRCAPHPQSVLSSADKADMDVESFSEGILGAIVIKEGEMANVGSAIAYIAETEADLAAAKAKAGGGEHLFLCISLKGCVCERRYTAFGTLCNGS